MDTDDLKWLQKVVPLAYNALQAVSRCSRVSTPTSQESQISSPKIRRRRQPTPSHSRRIWVRQENLSRDVDGLFVTAFYTANNPKDFRQRTNMTPQVFDMLFSLVGEQLNKNSIRQPILPECRLFVTLVYLSHAERLSVLARAFKMGNSTIRGIVQETCELLWNTLAPAFLPPPNAEDWRKISLDYQQTWQWPHCLGAVDVRLLNIDYKDDNDIALMASCDAHLNFNCVDIATVIDPIHRELHWHHEFACQLLLDQTLGEDLLPAEPISDLDNNPRTNYVYSFIADAKFPMRHHLLTPYRMAEIVDEEQLQLNQNLSRVLVGSIDKAFSLLVSRWRILAEPMRQSSKKAVNIVRATLVLHNFLNLHDETYSPPDYLEQLPMYDVKHPVPPAWLSSRQQSLATCNGTLKLRECLMKM